MTHTDLIIKACTDSLYKSHNIRHMQILLCVTLLHIHYVLLGLACTDPTICSYRSHYASTAHRSHDILLIQIPPCKYCSYRSHYVNTAHTHPTKYYSNRSHDVLLIHIPLYCPYTSHYLSIAHTHHTI